MNNEESKLKEMMNKFIDEIPIIEEKEVLHCPACNERLMYMEPDGNILYCKKCEKFFKNDNQSVGEETTNPYTNSNFIY